MRAWEIITEGRKRRHEISLRQLNHIKQEDRARAASHARRLPIVRAMYANPEWAQERIELEKVWLDLEQQRAEVAASKAEAHSETQEAIDDMADAGSKAKQQSRAKVGNMAKAAMRRRKKWSTE